MYQPTYVMLLITFLFCIFRYFSQRLGSKFDHGAETLLPVLLNLIPNSAKIMATSGTVCVRFILQVSCPIKG